MDNMVILRARLLEAQADGSIDQLMSSLSEQSEFNKPMAKIIGELKELIKPIRHEVNKFILGEDDQGKELWEKSFSESFCQVGTLMDDLKGAGYDEWGQWVSGYIWYEKLSHRHATEPIQSFEEKEREKWGGYIKAGVMDQLVHETDEGWRLTLGIWGLVILV